MVLPPTQPANLLWHSYTPVHAGVSLTFPLELQGSWCLSISGLGGPLTIRSTTIADVPLHPAFPLLNLTDTAHLILEDVTLSRLNGTGLGALRFTNNGPATIHAANVSCSDVVATAPSPLLPPPATTYAWACILVSAQLLEFRLSSSNIYRNRVDGSPAVPGPGGSSHLVADAKTYGAVVVVSHPGASTGNNPVVNTQLTNISIAGCTFDNNTASGPQARGAALAIVALLPNGTDPSDLDLAAGPEVQPPSPLLVHLTNSTFVGNNADRLAGGLYVSGVLGHPASDLCLSNSTFSGNGATGDDRSDGLYATGNGNGGAMAVMGPLAGNLTVDRSNFVGNLASNAGGAVFVSSMASPSSRFLSLNSNWTSNMANGTYGATYAVNAGGGAVAINSSLAGAFESLDSNWSLNAVPSSDGGAVRISGWILGSGLFNSTQSAWTNNSCNERGGVVFIQQGITGRFQSLRSSWSDNSADTFGGAGGGVLCTMEEGLSAPGALFLAQDSVFERNRASSGGVVYIQSGGIVAGAVFLSLNSTWLGNRATWDGGAVKVSGGVAGTMEWADGSMAAGNSAQRGSGGVVALALVGLLLVKRSTFVSNSASAGGVVHMDGNLTSGGRVWFVNSSFTNNSAEEWSRRRDIAGVYGGVVEVAGNVEAGVNVVSAACNWTYNTASRR